MVEPDARSTDILLVDNDSRILELVAWYLAKRGFTVRTALSFHEARELLASRLPDLLLSDIDLGEENAREELPRLAALGLLPPTLVVSGYLDADVVSELETLPQIVGTLAKPYDFAVLEERVRASCALVVDRAPTEGAGARAPSTLDAGGHAEDEDGWIEVVPHDPAAGRAGAEPAREPEARPAPFRLS